VANSWLKSSLRVKIRFEKILVTQTLLICLSFCKNLHEVLQKTQFEYNGYFKYFDKIKEFVEKVVKENTNLADSIEIVSLATKLENRQLFKEHFKDLKVSNQGKIQLDDC